MRADPISQQGGSAPPASARARESIEYTCRLLASYGVQLTAETLRQAKFDGAAVRSVARAALLAQTRPHNSWPPP